MLSNYSNLREAYLDNTGSYTKVKENFKNIDFDPGNIGSRNRATLECTLKYGSCYNPKNTTYYKSTDFWKEWQVDFLDNLKALRK